MHPCELQVCYQRNMLIGMCFAVVLALGGGAALRLLDGGGADDTRALPLITTVIVRDSSVVIQEVHPARRLRNILDPRVRQLDGFLGFTNLRPEPTVPEPIAVPMPVLTVNPEAGELEDADVFSFSPFEGTDTGVYLPSNTYLIPGPFDRRPVRSPVNQDVQVAYRVDPEYPFVARDARREGEVVALVYVDSLGRLAVFPDWIQGETIKTLEFTINGEARAIDYALVEDPSGWFFAVNFLKVLPEWRFIPRIEDSKPVSSLLRIRYRFCMGAGCSRFELMPVTMQAR